VVAVTRALVVPSVAGGAAVVTGAVVADGMAVVGAESTVSGATVVTGAVAGERPVFDRAGRVFRAGLWGSTETLNGSLVRALLFLVAGAGSALVFL
jgi:hypothetical protein